MQLATLCLQTQYVAMCYSWAKHTRAHVSSQLYMALYTYHDVHAGKIMCGYYIAIIMHVYIHDCCRVCTFNMTVRVFTAGKLAS